MNSQTIPYSNYGSFGLINVSWVSFFSRYLILINKDGRNHYNMTKSLLLQFTCLFWAAFALVAFFFPKSAINVIIIRNIIFFLFVWNQATVSSESMPSLFKSFSIEQRLELKTINGVKRATTCIKILRQDFFDLSFLCEINFRKFAFLQKPPTINWRCLINVRGNSHLHDMFPKHIAMLSFFLRFKSLVTHFYKWQLHCTKFSRHFQERYFANSRHHNFREFVQHFFVRKCTLSFSRYQIFA